MQLTLKQILKPGGVAVLFALVAFALFPALAGAATFTVNTTADNPPAPGECEGAAGDCSLRQAIDMANGEAGPDKVVLPAGAYALTIEPTGGTPGDSGDLNVLGELTIEGAGARKSVIDAGPIEDRVLELETGGSLRLVDLGVTGGRTSKNGGGIYAKSGKLALEGVAVTDNESYEKGFGGGISMSTGTLTIVDSLLAGNRNSGDGGAIFFDHADLVRIENSTLANNVVNTALYPTEPGWAPFGGAMEAFGETLVLKNDTIAGNRLTDGNGHEEGSGVALYTEFTDYEVVNTIIADNIGTEVDKYGQCETGLESLGHNLETEEPAGEPRCFEAPTDLIADPLLGGLADNGGETDTMALAAGSPAIDSGDSALCLPTDQRGVARPLGGGCDIGAFEFVPPPAPPAPTPTTTANPQLSAQHPSPPIGSFRFKNVKRNLKNGTASLAIQVTGSGRLTLTGRNVKAVAKNVGTGIRYLAIVPTGKLKATLAKRGQVKATVKISFKTTANVWTRSKGLVIRRKLPTAR